jgi:hypothetical protein
MESGHGRLEGSSTIAPLERKSQAELLAFRFENLVLPQGFYEYRLCRKSQDLGPVPNSGRLETKLHRPPAPNRKWTRRIGVSSHHLRRELSYLFTFFSLVWELVECS